MARFGRAADGDIGGKRAWHFDSENAAGEGGRRELPGRMGRAAGKEQTRVADYFLNLKQDQRARSEGRPCSQENVSRRARSDVVAIFHGFASIRNR